MSAPPHTERRPQGDHPDTGDVLSTSATPILRRIGPACDLCGGRLGHPKPGRHVCPQCHLDILEGLRRRRAAELRLSPLSDIREAS